MSRKDGLPTLVSSVAGDTSTKCDIKALAIMEWSDGLVSGLGSVLERSLSCLILMIHRYE